MSVARMMSEASDLVKGEIETMWKATCAADQDVSRP